LIEGTHDYETITDKISGIVLSTRPPLVWFAVVGISFTLVNVLLVSIGYLLFRGIGIWGNNIPVGGRSTSSTSSGGSGSATRAR
jgi:molybdopterin-containing oxidoreductase family membrane subunit